MATVTTPSTPTAFSPDVTGVAPQDVLDQALLLTCATRVGTVEGDAPSVRVPMVLDDGSPGFVDEGAEIGDAGQQFGEAVVQTRKLATVGRYSRETLAQQPAAQLIQQSLSRSITASADTALMSNSGEPAGLIGQATDGGAIATTLDPLVDAVSAIEADGGQASNVVAAPDAWAAITKLKADDTSAVPLLPSGNAPTERAVLGVPVQVSNAVPAGQVLILDRSTVLAAYGEVQVSRSEDAFFTSDAVAIRVAWRVGWVAANPARLLVLTTGTPAE